MQKNSSNFHLTSVVSTTMGTWGLPQMELTRSADRWCRSVPMIHQPLFYVHITDNMTLTWWDIRDGYREPVLNCSVALLILRSLMCCCLHLCHMNSFYQSWHFQIPNCPPNDDDAAAVRQLCLTLCNCLFTFCALQSVNLTFTWILSQTRQKS